MSARITANRPEVSSTFRVAGFTVRTGLSPSWVEVALATEPELFWEANARRNHTNFYSSRAEGPLPAMRGDAVYLVPPAVMARFAGQPKLYYVMATYRQPDFRNPEVVRLPTAAIPAIQISKSFTSNLRGLTGVPNPAGGLTGNGNRYANGNPAALEWGGDTAAPGEVVAVTTPANDARRNGAGSTNDAPQPVATQSGVAIAYDDGFDPQLWSRTPDTGADDEHYGIEAPIPDNGASSEAQSYSRSLSVPEYSQASRFVPAAAGNYRTSTAPRTINRIVIHITDGRANINGPISWFQNPSAKVSAHYIVGQDGEVVQMVPHNDVAWHARSANGDSIGIEHVANTSGLNPTEAQYCASAALVHWLAEQYNIPMDRTHILGHSEADPNTSHTGCPNSVWNWDYFMGMVTSGTCYPMATTAAQGLGARPARALASDIPLDPGNGGLSIGLDALAVGDIIVSTTNQIPSRLIRFGSGAPVSHAMIYTGDGGQVVEAIGEGIVFRPLAEAIADATVAVAFRHPDLTDEQAWQIRDFVGQQIGRSYNYMGIVRQALFQIDRATVCRLLSGPAYDRCINFVGRVDLGTATNDTFFCSELVLAAYQAAGVPLTATPPNWGSPGDLAELRLSGMLNYVGHLKAPPLGTSQGLAAASMSRQGGDSPTRQMSASRATVPPRPSSYSARAFTGESFDINWNDVYVVPQPTNMSCWATAAAMIVGWREQMSLSPTYLAQLAGRTDANGLNPADVPAVARAWNLALEPPQSYSIDAFRHMLETAGPLWVGAITPLGRHAIVVTGMYSDGNPDGSDTYVRVLDPWDRDPGTPGHPGAYQATHDQGSAYTLTWDEFAREYEAGITSSNGAVNIQIIHAGGTEGRRIGLGVQTQSLGRQVSLARAAPPLRTARSMQVVEIASAIVGATMSRILDNQGDISWELDQLQGLKHPWNNPANAGSTSYSTTTITLSGPRASTVLGEDEIYADTEITFQYNGHSLGNVQISTTHANDAVGAGLVVKANIMDDANTYTHASDPAQFAAIKVRLHYRFTFTWPHDDYIAITDLVLYGNGSHDKRFRWTQS